MGDVIYSMESQKATMGLFHLSLHLCYGNDLVIPLSYSVPKAIQEDQGLPMVDQSP